MDLILSKFIIFLFKPLVWVLVLLAIAFFTKQTSIRRRLMITGVIVFYFFSNGAIFNQVLNAYEAKYETYGKYDVGIVLGGFAGSNSKNGNIEFYGSADRLFQTIYLYEQGIIKKILISAGSFERVEKKKIEANIVAKYLKGIGIPDSAVMIEDQSRNTVENASNSYKVITKIEPNAKILVITSALHVPRAKVIFSKYFGDDLAYYPTDYKGKPTSSFADFVIPSPDVLAKWELILKEWVGLIVDRFRT